MRNSDDLLRTIKQFDFAIRLAFQNTFFDSNVLRQQAWLWFSKLQPRSVNISIALWANTASSNIRQIAGTAIQ